MLIKKPIITPFLVSTTLIKLLASFALRKLESGPCLYIENLLIK